MRPQLSQRTILPSAAARMVVPELVIWQPWHLLLRSPATASPRFSWINWS